MNFLSNEDLHLAKQILVNARAQDGKELFRLDVRDKSIFIELIYSEEIGKNFSVTINNKKVDSFEKHVSFVAIRNGQHNSIGTYLDTGFNKSDLPKINLPIQEIFNEIRKTLINHPSN